jgi:hypothetical protein
MRHHKFVVWIMIIAVAAGALPATAAPTASTWGGVKRLYMGEAEFVLGPGVSDSQAAQAMQIVAERGASFAGPAHVSIAGNSSQGKVLAVMGRTAAGSADAHLVTEAGAYLGGATADPSTGTVRDFVSGTVLVRDDGLRDLTPAGVGSVVTRLGRALCSTVITPLITSLYARLLKSGDMDIKTLVGLALCALILSVCESLADIQFEQVQTPDVPATGANAPR